MAMTGPLDESAAPTPQESLEVIDATLRDARRAFGFSDAPLYVVWGLAWLILFGVIQLVAAPAYAPLSHLPLWAAGAVGVVAIGGAVVFSGLHGARQSRGIGGASQRMGRRIGVAWVTTFVTASLMVGLMGLAGPLSGALFVFAVAVLYMGQGAVFVDDVQFGTGVWLAAVNVAALLSGPELFNLLAAVLGGGGLLAAGVLARRRGVKTADGV